MYSLQMQMPKALLAELMFENAQQWLLQTPFTLTLILSSFLSPSLSFLIGDKAVIVVH